VYAQMYTSIKLESLYIYDNCYLLNTILIQRILSKAFEPLTNTNATSHPHTMSPSASSARRKEL
jgi:hypothetical protein